MKRLISFLLCLFALTISAQTPLTADGLAAFIPTATGGGGGGGNPFALVDHGVAHADSPATATVTLNTTGAKLIVAVLSSFSDSSPTFTDSGGNTWTIGTEYSASFGNVRIAYCINPSGTGAGHTFSWTDTYIALCVTAWSYSGGTVTHEAETGSNNGGSGFTTIQPGSQTPGGNNRLFVAGLGGFNSGGNPIPLTIDSSFVTDSSFQDFDGAYQAVGAFYLLQTTSAAKNPTVTSATAGTTGGVVMDSFY